MNIMDSVSFFPFAGGLWSPSTTVLMQIPDFVTPEDIAIFQSPRSGSRSWVRCYEAMIRRYGNHPFFVAGLADHLWWFGAISIAERMFREVKKNLEGLGIEDTCLDKTIEHCSNAAARQAEESSDEFSKLEYTQFWRPSREYKFPADLPLPDGHEEIKETWAKLLSQDEDYRRKYLVRHAIDTNHVEHVLLLGPGSVDDVVRRGVDKGRVWPNEPITWVSNERDWMRDIICDTASGCDIISELASEPQQLSRQKIRDVHAKITEAYRFVSVGYISPGETRTATRRMVRARAKGSTAQCCPYMNVDEEVDFICNETKEHIRTQPQNPFAIASWLHLLLAQCNPFDGGNERIARMIASVPLIAAGYPMINIDIDQREEYREGMRRAREGDHGPLVECFVDGMRKTLDYIQKLEYTAHDTPTEDSNTSFSDPHHHTLVPSRL